VCAEIEPNFYKASSAQLIKSTQPFECIGVDLKEPFSSLTKNDLAIVDEH